MMEILKAPAAHVVAFSFDGKLNESEFDKIVEQIDATLQTQERINIYCDLTRLTGLTPKALLKDILYGLSTFGRMYRFQRMAAVTDSSALESVIKFEDRMFSNIELKSFPSERRDEALAWIESKVDVPAPGVRVLEVEAANLVQIDVGDEVTGFDVRRVVAVINERYKIHGPVNLLVSLEKTPRFGPGLFYEKLQALAVLPMVNKYAVLGPPWVRNWIRTVGAAVVTRIRHFLPADRAAAFAWIGDRTPVIERLPSDETHILSLRLNGKLGKKEIESLYHLILPSLGADNEIDLFLEVPYIEGLSISGLLQAIKLGIQHFSDLSRGVRRVALVTDSRWLSKWVDIENLLVPGIEERPFSFAQKGVALAWLREGREGESLTHPVPAL